MPLSVAHRTEAPLTLYAQTAADLMIPDPVSMRAEAKVSDAITLFTEKGIAAAPVIDDAGRPIGVISRTDLLVHQREHEKQCAGQPEYFFTPTFDSPKRPGDGKASVTCTVVDLMTPAVFAVSPDTPVHRVVSDMVGLHVHRLFVVDDDGILVGVISTMDVLKHLRSRA